MRYRTERRYRDPSAAVNGAVVDQQRGAYPVIVEPVNAEDGPCHRVLSWFDRPEEPI